jgi:hypothetical protein
VSVLIVNSDDPTATSSLYGWLTRYPELGTYGTVAASVGPDEAMGAIDIIDVVLTHVTGVGALLLALVSWRRTRAAEPTIKLKVNRTEIIIKSDSPQVLEATRLAVQAALFEDPADAP